MFDTYFAVLVGINAFFLVTAVWNIVYLRRATKSPSVTSGPFVSVIVPARDEARSIGRCLESLLTQDYAGYEVVVVDDQSSDTTSAIVTEIAMRDPRVRLVTGVPLPDGWLGKTHALAQAAAVARGEILVLTDADTVHEPQSISWAVTNMQSHGADIVSGYLSQEYGSFGERIIVPTMYAMMLVTPLSLIPRTKNARFAFAIGQYVVLRRAALDDIGGFEAIRDSVVDDMQMAIRMKEFGHRGVFLDATAAARCRLYAGYRHAFAGIRRSMYSAVGGTVMAAFAVAVLVLGLIVGPALFGLLAALRLQPPTAPIAVAIGLFVAQWALVAWDRDVPFIAVLLYPLVFLDLVAILIASLLGTGFGRGVDWKGRLVRVPRSPSVAGEAGVADLAGKSDKVR
jgi:chlorobactene glucosyltransferase